MSSVVQEMTKSLVTSVILVTWPTLRVWLSLGKEDLVRFRGKTLGLTQTPVFWVKVRCLCDSSATPTSSMCRLSHFLYYVTWPKMTRNKLNVSSAQTHRCLSYFVWYMLLYFMPFGETRLQTLPCNCCTQTNRLLGFIESHSFNKHLLLRETTFFCCNISSLNQGQTAVEK